MMWSVSWLFVLEALLIVVGNGFTIVIFTSTPRLRRRKYALIVSLAVADLLVGMVSIPLHLISEAVKMTRIHHIIYVVQDGWFGTASLLGLTMLAVERAFATYFPVKHRMVGNIPYIVGIVLIWVFSLTIAVSSFFTNKFTLVKVVTVALALVIMTVAYLLIVLQINCKGSTPNHVIHRGSKKLTVTLGIVTIVSLVTLLPYKILLLYVAIYYYPLTVTFYWLRNAAKFLYYSNSMANPIVYAFRMRELKREILRRLRCFGGNQVFPSDGVELGNMGTTSAQ